MQFVYEKYLTVSPEHLDKNQHVNNVQYVHWMEEMAQEHWDLVKNETPYPTEVWVLVDHHIQYRKQVFLGEELRMVTYAQTPEGIRQPRKVEFYRGKDLVVDSRTLWVLMNPETQKIVRIPADWIEKLK